jgi:hypothetical protein
MQGGLGLRQSDGPNDQHLKQDIRSLDEEWRPARHSRCLRHQVVEARTQIHKQI